MYTRMNINYVYHCITLVFYVTEITVQKIHGESLTENLQRKMAFMLTVRGIYNYIKPFFFFERRRTISLEICPKRTLVTI